MHKFMGNILPVEFSIFKSNITLFKYIYHQLYDTLRTKVVTYMNSPGKRLSVRRYFFRKWQKYHIGTVWHNYPA